MSDHLQSLVVADQQQPPGKPARHPLLLWLLANIRWIWPLIAIIVIFVISWSDLSKIELRQVRQVLYRMDPYWLWLAVLLTATNLAVMGIYDVVCLHGTQMRRRERWWIGTLAFAWSNFLALGPLAGPAVRFWLYRPYGINFNMLRQAVLSIVVGIGSGLVIWLPFALLPLPFTDGISFLVRAGLVFAAAAGAGLLARRIQRWQRLPIWVRDVNVSWPVLFILGALDWLLAVAVFSFCVRAAGTDYSSTFLVRLYFLGQGVGVLSLVPGGLGSMDVFWLSGLGAAGEKGAAGILVFRIFYYVLPWTGATLLLLRRAVHGKVRWAGPARSFVSLIVIASGVVMLVSSATPALAHRIEALNRYVPIAVLESSHLASALFGLFLFVVARGLMKGYRFSYRTALALLMGGAAGSLLKGLDYEEAIIFLLTAAVLWTHAELFMLPARKGGTAVAICAPIILAIFVFAAVGFASYDGAQLAGTFWSSFPMAISHSHGVFSFLRALSMLLLFGLLISIYLVMRIPHHYVPPSRGDIDRALGAHRRLGKGTAALTAANADKAILFLKDRGFCLYRTFGKYMVVFADPTVEPGTEKASVGMMLQRAAELDRTLVFYQISARWLPVLHDFGYSFFKLGEEAHVDLHSFSLQANKGMAVHEVLNRFARDGYGFQVLEGRDIRARLEEMKAVSDAWLRNKNVRERQFSIGSFSAAYMTSYPCALVTDSQGRAVAFANLLPGPNREELSVDLTRYLPECPDGIRDFVILRLFEWGKSQGYRTFNLGMAPLATAGANRRAHIGERLASILFQGYAHWYSLRGLRLFKQKFDPRWTSRYVAYPAFRMRLPVILNVAALIAGGWRNVIFPAEKQS